MTRRAPKDPAFNRVVADEIVGPATSERVIFIDTDNRVREAVYAAEFGSGEHLAVRQRLEDEGVLKAVVHVKAVAINPGGHGPFKSTVEYLPDQTYYTFLTGRPFHNWDALDQEGVESTRELFGNGEGEED